MVVMLFFFPIHEETTEKLISIIFNVKYIEMKVFCQGLFMEAYKF